MLFDKVLLQTLSTDIWQATTTTYADNSAEVPSFPLPHFPACTQKRWLSHQEAVKGLLRRRAGQNSFIRMALAVSGFLFSNCLSFYLKMWVVQAEFALYKVEVPEFSRYYS